MFIDVEFIDKKGMWHKKTAKSLILCLKWLESLKEGTEIRWKNERSVFVNQQYVK